MLEKIRDGEVVINNLSDDDMKAYQEMCDHIDDLQALARRFARCQNVAQAKKVLFWDRMQGSCERSESAESRGRMIGVRVDKDGIPVLVEYDINPCSCGEQQMRFINPFEDGGVS